MRFQGRVYRDSGVWLAEVPIFDAMTQGRTKSDALDMMRDWFETMAGTRDFTVEIYAGRAGDFEVGSPDLGRMIGLLLEKRRQQSGLSLRQAAARLGERSPNAYARYERGDSVPTMTKLDELLRAVGDRDLVLMESAS